MILPVLGVKDAKKELEEDRILNTAEMGKKGIGLYLKRTAKGG